MKRLDFNSPEFNKTKYEKLEYDLTKSTVPSILSIAKKINLKVTAILVIYLVLFGLASNIALIVKYPLISFYSTATITAAVILYKQVRKLFKRNKNGK